MLWHINSSLASNCCTDGEVKEDPDSCLSYLLCCGGQFVQQSCNSGDYWNSASQKCEVNNGQCPGTDTCTENDIKLDPQDCAAYYQCCNGQFVNLKCASGTYFDTTLKACVVDTEGVCPS